AQAIRWLTAIDPAIALVCVGGGVAEGLGTGYQRALENSTRTPEARTTLRAQPRTRPPGSHRTTKEPSTPASISATTASSLGAPHTRAQRPVSMHALGVQGAVGSQTLIRRGRGRGSGAGSGR
ncbi:hypothetical protein ACVNF4_26970, partial [Streptomyces sp. S6]